MSQKFHHQGTMRRLWSFLVVLSIMTMALEMNGRVAAGQSAGFDRLRTLNLTAAAMREAVAKIEPAMVTIESYGGSGAVAGRIGGIRKQGEGNTTGIMIDPNGYILTSTFNFIQQPPVITVITSDGKKHFARPLGKDNTRKLCILKIDNVSDQPYLLPVDPDRVQVGQWAISVGVGFGDSNPALSSGIISAKNRIGGKALQTDANISPACYGGPLIDIEGNFLGVCVPMNPQSQAIGAGVEWYDSGIGFAIPLFGLDGLLERLKQGEVIEPAFLGVQTLAGKAGEGLMVQATEPNSPADEIGLKSGDLLLEFNGEKIVDVLSLRQMLGRHEAGQTVKLKYRDGETEKELEVELKLGVAPAASDQPQLEPPKIR